MRVVALAVLLCGCRVDMAAPAAVDAAAIHGDGLADRVIVDSARWWADVAGNDAQSERADAARGADGAGARDGAADGVDADGNASSQSCSLLGGGCASRQGCYPFPFAEVSPSGETRCAFQGGGAPTVPCQSQLECDGTTLCSAPGEPDSTCRPRCDMTSPLCAPGSVCVPFAGYPNVGTCV